MENKRFQVFVSSTFDDLKEERSHVFDTITRMNYIPAEMEFFPAYDEDQLDFIKTIIDDSDYYAVITAGKYGSESSDGFSFTEKEYRYAQSRNIPILSFLHGELGAISADKTERDESKRVKLETFRASLSSGRLVKYWRSKEELTLQVTQALQYVARTRPGVGWIRGKLAATSEILGEINDLRKGRDALVEEIRNLQSQLAPRVDNVAGIEESITLRFNCSNLGTQSRIRTLPATWKQLFSLVGPSLVAPKGEAEIGESLSRYLAQQLRWSENYIILFDEDLTTIKLQFVALELISMKAPSIGGGGVVQELLQLTDRGTQALIGI